MMSLLLLGILATAPWKDWMLGPFSRPSPAQPVLRPDASAVFPCPMRGAPVAWESDNVYNPAATVYRSRVCLLFRAEDGSGEGIGAHTSRIGLAESRDGLSFEVQRTPVLFPANDKDKRFEWPGGCEDPRIVASPHGFVLTYTAWDRKTARLSVATSTDLVHWVKHGSAFSGRFAGEWSKSGAIVTSLQGDSLMAVKVQGRYWMYWGEGSIKAATSTDLIHWEPILDSSGEPLAVLPPREGRFDSGLTEPGPPAVLTKNGIVLIYNGKNSDDPSIPAGAYSAGQALLDPSAPTVVLDLTDAPFFRPEEPYERTGQYGAGTVFTEGLAHLGHRWLLYYGAADSVVGCAVAEDRD